VTGPPRPGADTYARWRATPLGRITEDIETRAVFALAGPLAGQRVLDVGTGDGTYAVEAAARGANVTALDLDPRMLDAAQARASQRGVSVALHRGRAESLPFAEGSFDVVLAVTVLCMLADAPRTVGELARALAPGGRLVLADLGRFSVWAALRRLRGWIGSTTWRNAHFYSRADLKRLVREAGLQVVAVRGSVFFPPSDLAARAMAPLEPMLTRLHTPGAAFLTLAADKPRLP
jgi:2-polyprenyl-3-methyl-5-hydroxy-6-metoxy-1,4-benzoquinol methylase